MKKYFRTVLMLLMAFYLQSCEKDIMVYEGESGDVSGVYFLYSSRYTMSGGIRVYHYQDSIETSFTKVLTNIDTMVVGLPVRVIGNVSDKDRTFKVRVSAGTAVEGVDYRPLQDNYLIPAGKEKVNIPVILLRTGKLKKEKLNLTVELVENENFKLLLPTKINDDGKTELVTTRLKVVFSEIYTQPFFYQIFGMDYFGPFTIKKFEFINMVMLWSAADWDSGKVVPGIFSFAARKVQSELQKRADNKKPEYDEGGNYMQLVAPYLVDYSEYETE